jgi:creatinine amidohydrolase
MANLASARWPDLGPSDVVLIPLGSTEQHGPHLPFSTDTVIADAIAQSVAEALTAGGVTTTVAPALAVGASGEHQSFAGTISIGHEALGHVLIEMARSVKTWAPRLVFVNGHGGNVPALRAACDQLRAEDHEVVWVACGVPGQDAHAGREETSLMLLLEPHNVRMHLAVTGAQEPLRDLMPVLVEGGVHAVSPSGVLGNPIGATAQEGNDLMRRISGEIVGQLFSFWPELDPQLGAKGRD